MHSRASPLLPAAAAAAQQPTRVRHRHRRRRACCAQGINTVVITASIIPNSGNITDGSVHLTMPEEPVTLSSGPIDFYFFMDARPAATVSFATCTPDRE